MNPDLIPKFLLGLEEHERNTQTTEYQTYEKG